MYYLGDILYHGEKIDVMYNISCVKKRHEQYLRAVKCMYGTKDV
jgi:hypothetical protein